MLTTTTKMTWGQTKPRLWYSAVTFACAAFLLGTMETASTTAANIWPGKLIGTFAFEPLVERFGYRKLIYACCLAQVLEAILTTTLLNSQEEGYYYFPLLAASTSKIFFASVITGLLENALPSYQAEMKRATAPSSSPSQGGCFFAGFLMAFATLGSMLGSSLSGDMSHYYYLGNTNPTVLRCLPAFLILATLPFCQSSSSSSSRGTSCSVSSSSSSIRRVAVTAFLLWFNHHAAHGTNQMMSASSPPCYHYSHQNRYYPFLVQGLSFLASTAGVLLAVDLYGRRPVLVVGVMMVGIFNLVVRGAFYLLLSGQGQEKEEEKIVAAAAAATASVMLLGSCVRFSVSTLVYLVVSELSSVSSSSSSWENEEEKTATKTQEGGNSSRFRGLLRAVTRLDVGDLGLQEGGGGGEKHV